ncbi:MAG: hypothetical protein R3F29_03520 [Planctomycetota bacterium]
MWIPDRRHTCCTAQNVSEGAADRLDVLSNLSVHVVTGDPAADDGGKNTKAMHDFTETNESLHACLAAQTAIADTRDALLRAALSLPNNLAHLADGGSFASTVVDLVRAIADARLAKHRAAVGYLRASDAVRTNWDSECAEATRRELAYTIERLQQIEAAHRQG